MDMTPYEKRAFIIVVAGVCTTFLVVPILRDRLPSFAAIDVAFWWLGISGLLIIGGVTALIMRLMQTSHRRLRYRLASQPGWMMVALGVGSAGVLLLPHVYVGATSYDLLVFIPLILVLLSQFFVLWAKRER